MKKIILSALALLALTTNVFACMNCSEQEANDQWTLQDGASIAALEKVCVSMYSKPYFVINAKAKALVAKAVGVDRAAFKYQYKNFLDSYKKQSVEEPEFFVYNVCAAVMSDSTSQAVGIPFAIFAKKQLPSE